MKAVILDMHGVIVKHPEGGLMPFVRRTFPDLAEEDVYRHWASACTGGMTSLEYMKSIGYQGDMSGIEKEYLDTLEIDESFYAAADAIRKSHRLALLSNDIAEWSRYARDKFKLDHLFDVVVVSGDVGLRKPDPEIYRLALDRLGCPASHCTFVDDRRKNLAAARSLGMETILFNSRNVVFDGKTVDAFEDLARMLA